MQTKALPGFREFYPADLALRTHIVRTWRTVATRYGFEEYDGPPLEPLELYTAKSGDEIVGQLYPFVRLAEDEFARVENEGVVGDLDKLGQLLLFLLDVDERVEVVAEDAEVAVDAHVDARRLEQRGVVGIDLDPALGEEARDRAV